MFPHPNYPQGMKKNFISYTDEHWHNGDTFLAPKLPASGTTTAKMHFFTSWGHTVCVVVCPTGANQSTNTPFFSLYVDLSFSLPTQKVFQNALKGY